MTTYDIVIIGGGFAGIYSAWRLVRDGAKVALVEASDHIGGTMRSREWRGFLVDPGTHNFDLRSPIGADFYYDILGDSMRESNFANWASTIARTWSYGFEMPDFGEDDPDLCHAALEDLASLKGSGTSPDPPDARGYDGWMRQYFGLTLALRLKPMAEKTIGHSSADLAVESRGALGMFARPKLGSDQEMVALKASDAFYDDRLGVTLRANEPRFYGRSAVLRFGYPRQGALRAFCTAAEARLTDLGVSLRKNSRVEAILPQAAGLAVRTNVGSLKAGRALWTLPDHSLTRLLGFDIDFREITLPVGHAIFAFEVHRDNILGPDYLHDFSTERLPFRYNSCGLYSGQVRDDGTTFVMAEVPAHPANRQLCLSDDVAAKVWADLVDVGFIRSDAACSAHARWNCPVAYTLPKLGCGRSQPIAAAAEAVRQASERISTIAFGQRGRHSFMLHYESTLKHELKTDR